MKVLIVSIGPVPGAGNSIVEGGGIRAWTIQQGLMASNVLCDVIAPEWTIQKNNPYQFSFSSYTELLQIAKRYNAVILNYAIGDVGLNLFRELPNSILRIADLYVPIHVEVMAREISKAQLEEETLNYERSCRVWEETLKYSDIFLVTSREQRHYYLGLLSGLHFMNPRNYKETKFIELPQAIINENYHTEGHLTDNTDTINIVWWGGFYPWFKAESIEKLATILHQKGSRIQIQIVGAINPFVKSKNFINFATQNLERLENYPNITIKPWVSYENRFKIFETTDAVLSLNRLNAENEISWRTRLLDCIEFQKPLLTNGGDPFGEKIISNGGGFRISDEPEKIADFLLAPEFKDKLEQASNALAKFKAENNSRTAASKLAEYLKSAEPSNLNWKEIRDSRLSLHRDPDLKISVSRIQNILKLAYIYLRRHGFYKFLKLTIHTVLRFPVKQLRKSMRQKSHIAEMKQITISQNSKNRNLVILIHQLDRSGAVLVALDIYNYLNKYSYGNLLILTPTINDESLLTEIEKKGYKVVCAKADSNIDEYLSNSDVLINSAAVPSFWMRQSLSHLNQNNRFKVAFFVHENEPNLFLSQDNISKMENAITKGLKIFVPSIGTSRQIDKLFGNNINSIVERIHVHQSPAKPPNYIPEEISVCVVGPTNDSRKRQIDILWAIYLAQQANRNKGHRNIKISFIGVTDDPIGLELRRLANQLLAAGSFYILPRMTHKRVLEEIGKCNVVVSLAENESFGIYIAEAMSSGAIVVRTRISGYEETVQESINGYGIDAKISDLAETLVRLSKLDNFSHQKFLQMMQKSSEMIQPFLESNYNHITDFFIRS